MREGELSLTPFQTAVATVENWLDSQSSAFITRARSPDPRQKFAVWELELEHPVVGRQRVRLSLPKDFPARVPEVFLDKKLCLVLPHIDEEGRLCHSVRPDPADYTAPCEAVKAVLRDLEVFWNKSQDLAWIQAEFHEERLSYWNRFSDFAQEKAKLPIPLQFRVVLKPFEVSEEGRAAVYSPEGGQARPRLLVATLGDEDPNVIAVRHGWSRGTLVRGHALFVQLTAEQEWTPRVWPRTPDQLEDFVAQVTDHQVSVRAWLEGKQDGNPHPYLVVLVQAGACFGYMFAPALVPRLTAVGLIPVQIERVDFRWALARDQEMARLDARRSKRVLVLGCGSLGGPIAELLARSGIGELQLLDREAFEPENCSRHVLGAADIAAPKAKALAERLTRAIPAIKVQPHVALATSWVPHMCKPGEFDLIVDCTGESAVREMLNRFRGAVLGHAHVVHAWLEPFGAAAHVLFLSGQREWPKTDLASRIDAAVWPDDARVELPACNSGFHPYAAADAWQGASLAAEKILDILDDKIVESKAWSVVRSRAFFATVAVVPQVRPWVDELPRNLERVQLERSLDELPDQ